MFSDAGLDYHLEREDEPGIALDPEKTLGDINCTEFAVVRDNSKYCGYTAHRHTHGGRFGKRGVA